MSDLLTTNQLLELLQVDRTTVYRMLSEGRVPGFKVGGQWRFSRQEIEAWLKEQSRPVPPPDETPSIKLSVNILPLDYTQPIQDIFAEALNVGAIMTRLDGEPITEISNCSPFCQLILSSPRGRKRCVDSWRSLAGQTDHKPRLHTCHAGLLYAPDGWGREATITDLVADCDLDANALRAAADQVYVVSPHDHLRLIRLLQKLADTLSEIGCQQLNLLNKLRSIAKISEL
jgi:excisionase family DNA binding protein